MVAVLLLDPRQQPVRMDIDTALFQSLGNQVVGLTKSAILPTTSAFVGGALGNFISHSQILS